MAVNTCILGLVVLALSAGYVLSSEKHIMCYYGTWATYRQGLGKFDVSSVDPHLCTHLVYTFVGIEQNGTVKSLDPYLDLADDGGRDNLRLFNELKQINPDLKTLLAVGGWNEGSAKYSTMAANPEYRANFIRSALKFVLDFGFDGFDLDWEYPAQRDTVYGQADVENFSQLLRELRQAFDQHQLLITAAVAPAEGTASLAYNITALYENLDIINLMTYDLYVATAPLTSHNAALYRGEGDKADEEVITVAGCVDYWLEQGCPPSKLALGVPFYGHTFLLKDPNVNGVKSPSSGPGIAGPYTATQGTIGYNEFCDLLQKESWDERRDELAKVPYAVQGRNWVSYDDPQSIADKVNYALEKNLGGIMTWSIETDDFNGVCGEKFVLLKTINRVLYGDVQNTTTTAANSPSTSTSTTTTSSSSTSSTGTSTTTSTSTLTTTISTTTTPTTTTITTTTYGVNTSTTTKKPTSITDPITIESWKTSTEAESQEITEVSTTEDYVTDDQICRNDGDFLRDLDDCSKYYVCVSDGQGGLNKIQMVCPSTLRWDQKLLTCNYPKQVNCDL